MKNYQLNDNIELEIFKTEGELVQLYDTINKRRQQLDQLKRLHIKISVERFPELNAA